MESLAFVLCNDCSKTRDVHVSAADITHIQPLSKTCVTAIRDVCFVQVAYKLFYVFSDIVHCINCEQGICNKVYVLPNAVYIKGTGR